MRRYVSTNECRLFNDLYFTQTPTEVNTVRIFIIYRDEGQTI